MRKSCLPAGIYYGGNKPAYEIRHLETAATYNEDEKEHRWKAIEYCLTSIHTNVERELYVSETIWKLTRMENQICPPVSYGLTNDRRQ